MVVHASHPRTACSRHPLPSRLGCRVTVPNASTAVLLNAHTLAWRGAAGAGTRGLGQCRLHWRRRLWEEGGPGEGATGAGAGGVGVGGAGARRNWWRRGRRGRSLREHPPAKAFPARRPRQEQDDALRDRRGHRFQTTATSHSAVWRRRRIEPGLNSDGGVQADAPRFAAYVRLALIRQGADVVTVSSQMGHAPSEHHAGHLLP